MKTRHIVRQEDMVETVYMYGLVLIKTRGSIYRYILNISLTTVNLIFQAVGELVIRYVKQVFPYNSCEAASTKNEDIKISYSNICSAISQEKLRNNNSTIKNWSCLEARLSSIQSELSEVKKLFLANINKTGGSMVPMAAPPPPPPPPPPPLLTGVSYGEPTTPLSSVKHTTPIKKTKLAEKFQQPVITVEALRSVKLSKTIHPINEKKVPELRSPYISVELLRSVKLRPSKHLRKSLELRSPKSLKAKSHRRKSVKSPSEVELTP